MKRFFATIIFFFCSMQLHCQELPVWKDSTALINSINIIINNDSLSNNLKLNLIYKFLEINKPDDLLDTNSIDFHGLTNATNNNRLQHSKENLQENDKKDKVTQQCQAITKKGTRCTRNAKSGSKFCWQHDK